MKLSSARWYAFSLLKKLLHAKIIDSRSLYKHWEIDTVRKLLRYCEVDCVFDIGANTGQYARMLRDDIGFRGLVISFEPHPEAAARLKQRAQYATNWIVEEKAISTEDGYASFNVMFESQFSSLSAPRHDKFEEFRNLNSTKASVRVKTEKLDTALKRLREAYGFERPFLKLDTQGFDCQIVESSRDCMRDFVALQSELSIVPLYESSRDYREAIALYQDCGFELSAFVPNNDGHFPKLLEIDCVMVRAGMSFSTRSRNEGSKAE